jgi:GNAT superfamily N-acetyltransferase
MSDTPPLLRSAIDITIAPAHLDEWAEIRDLHASAFRRLTAPAIGTAACDLFATEIHEPAYTSVLQVQDLSVARYDRHLVGTAGWTPSGDRDAGARITAVCVSPLFTRLGIGSRLVETAEARAALAGYDAFAVCTFPPAAGFFETLGYTACGRGVHAATSARDGLPVVFMRKSRAAAAPTGDSPDDVA